MWYAAIGIFALLALVPIPAYTRPTEGLRRMHRVSALLIVLFAAVAREFWRGYRSQQEKLHL